MVSVQEAEEAPLGRAADTAKEILEWVVDGPELVSIWEAFQTDEGEQPQENQARDDDNDSVARMDYLED